MDYLIAHVVIALIGPVFLALAVATVVAIPVGFARFDAQARTFAPGTGEILLRVYTVATGLGGFGAGTLVVGGVLAILGK